MPIAKSVGKNKKRAKTVYFFYKKIFFPRQTKMTTKNKTLQKVQWWPTERFALDAHSAFYVQKLFDHFFNQINFCQITKEIIFVTFCGWWDFRPKSGSK